MTIERSNKAREAPTCRSYPTFIPSRSGCRSSFSRHFLFFCPLPPPRIFAEKRQAKYALFSCARLADALTTCASSTESTLAQSLRLALPNAPPEIRLFRPAAPPLLLRSPTVELLIVFQRCTFSAFPSNVLGVLSFCLSLVPLYFSA